MVKAAREKKWSKGRITPRVEFAGAGSEWIAFSERDIASISGQNQRKGASPGRGPAPKMVKPVASQATPDGPL